MDKKLEKLLDDCLDLEFVKHLDENETFHQMFNILRDKKRIIPIIKYLFFGILTTIISLGSFWILIKLTKIDENICNFISILLGIISAYYLNRNYVFESKDKNIFKEFSKFLLARAGSSIFDIITFYIFVTLLKFPEMLVKVIISIVVVILNYFFSKLFVFKKNKN